MKRHLLLVIILQFLTTAAFAYKAHEWGTFTSLVGSDGVTQNGMYHEDERLPDFVHGFGVTQSLLVLPDFNDDSDCPIFTKSCFSFSVLQNNFVSQKMETPVIYFYSDEALRVNVDVEFPEGIITETFPAPTFSTPKPSDDLKFENGRATFVVDVLDKNSTLQPPLMEDGNIYGHARHTQSNLVKTNSEVEKFIFYRGLGRFTPKIKISSQGNALSIFSRAANLPSAAFLVYVNEDKSTRMLPIINGNRGITPIHLAHTDSYIYQVTEEMIQDLKVSQGGFHDLINGILSGDDIKQELILGLANSGLFTDEARSMINTWENGYLQVPGLRLLYILPQHEVDQILPLTMNPAPEDIQRVFVARIEIMLENEEKALVQRIMKEQLNFDISSLGRFAEPQLRRAQQVYTYEHNHFIPSIEGFIYGLHDVFEELVQRSLTQESSPLIVD